MRRTACAFSGVLLLAWVSSGVVAARQPMALSEACTEAQQAIETENFGRAIQLLEPHQEDTRARELLLRAYRRSLRFVEGVAAVETWVAKSRANRASSSLVVEGALLLGDAGRVAAGLELLDTALAGEEKSGALYKARARLRFAVGDCPGAFADAKVALTSGDDSVGVNYLCGAALSRVSDSEPIEVERYLTRALELDSKHELTLFELGRLRLRQNRIDDAVGLFRRVLYVNRSHAGALLQLGGALRRSGAGEEAARALARFQAQQEIAEQEKDLIQQLRNNLGNVEAMQELAYFRVEQGDYQQGGWLLQEVLRVTGSHADGRTWLALAQVARARKDLAFAFRGLQRALTLDESLTDARIELAEVAIELNRKDIARQVSERCKGDVERRRWLLCAANAAEDSEVRAAHLAAALVAGAIAAVEPYARYIGSRENRAEELKRLEDEHPKQALVQLVRAQVALANGDTKSCEKALHAARALDPWLPELSRLEAQWHTLCGRPAEATRAQERAQQLEILK